MNPPRRPRGPLLTTALALVAATLVGTVAAQAQTVESSAERPARCERPTDQPADSSAKHDLTVDGRERGFVLRLPRGYDKRGDWPLVIALHGRGSTGVEVEGYSDLSSLPAVVAYPDGVADPDDGDRFRRAWQGAPYAVDGVDDVAFTAALLDDLQADYCLDASRTYVTGKSNGGGLASLLACRLPDRIAAVALVAPALYPQAEQGCADAPAVPTLLIHGTADATVPYGGDADRGLPAVQGWLEARAARDGCRPAPREGRIGRDVRTQRWTGCDDGSRLQHLAVVGGGHVWPGARTYSGGGHVTRTIDSHRQIWSFVSRHRLDDEGPRTKGEAS